MKNPNRVQASVMGVAARDRRGDRGARRAAGGQQGRGAAPVNDSRTTKEELDRWMKELSNWGRWGKDDQRGAANLITPAKRKQALALARTGETVSLAHDTLMDKAVDAATPFEHRTTIMAERGIAVEAAAGELPRVDLHAPRRALPHLVSGPAVQRRLVPARRSAKPAAATNLAITTFKDGIVTRGILLDIPAPEGRAVPGCPARRSTSKTSKPGRRRPGSRSAQAMPCSCAPDAGRAAPRRGRLPISPGSTRRSRPSSSGATSRLIGSDAVLDAGNVPGFPLAVHTFALVAVGVNIFDNADLEALSETAARLNRWEFLLMAAPVRVTNGTGSPINPIAVF